MAGIINKISVPNYSGAITYSMYDVVKNGAGNYYVSASDGNLNNTPTSSSTSYWKRFGNTDFDFSEMWGLDYGSRFTLEPRVIQSDLGQGSIRVIKPDGVNTKVLAIQASFKNRDLKITKSLLAFFEFMGGKFAFYWTIPEPYNMQKLFTCKTWNLVYNSHRQQTITATFLEERTPIITSGASGEGQLSQI